MNELQRMQYLETMGVDTFVPRWVLSGARQSSRCVLPQANPTQVDLSVRPLAGAATGASMPIAQHDAAASSPQAVGALVDALRETQPARKAPVAESLASSRVPGRPVEQVSFSLAFWRVHPRLIVVDSRQPKALPTEALLASIVSALQLSDRLPRADIQNWPVPGSRDSGWNAAQEMIQAYLESRLDGEPVSHMVLMGTNAARAIAPETLADLPEGQIHLAKFACHAILTPSLAELLLEPGRKAQLWTQLAPLRAAACE